MLLYKYPENFIRKSLSDGIDFLKIKNDNFELLNSREKPFGLRTRYKLFISILSKFYGNDRLSETNVIPRRILVVNLGSRSRSMITEFHKDCSASLKFFSLHNPIFCLAKLMKKINST